MSEHSINHVAGRLGIKFTGFRPVIKNGVKLPTLYVFTDLLAGGEIAVPSGSFDFIDRFVKEHRENAK